MATTLRARFWTRVRVCGLAASVTLGEAGCNSSLLGIAPDERHTYGGSASQGSSTGSGHQGGAGGSGDQGGMGMAGILQLDMSSVLIHDTVVNNGQGSLDAVQNPMDTSGYNLVTDSVARAFGGTAAGGLPDDAFFPTDTNHPDVQLHFRNTGDAPNSRVMPSSDSMDFAVPARGYSQVQVYGLSTMGSSVVAFNLGYGDGTTDPRERTFQDWRSDPPLPGQFFLVDYLDRSTSGLYDPAADFAISGANLDPDPQKTLVRITVTRPSQATGWFVLYGATAW